jgi:hypothetical protein
MYTPEPHPMPSKRGNRTVWIVVVLAGLALLCTGGVIAASVTGGDPPRAVGTPTGSDIPSRSPNPTSKAAPTSKKSASPAATIGGDDIVHVGEDVPAGTYRVVEGVGDGPLDYCAWIKSKDAEGADAIDAVPNGTIVRSVGCPDWRLK